MWYLSDFLQGVGRDIPGWCFVHSVGDGFDRVGRGGRGMYDVVMWLSRHICDCPLVHGVC